MQSLTIEAVRLASAQGFRAALAQFDTELVETESGGYQVKVALTGSDRAIVMVLRTLEDYVTQRADSPAKLRYAGRSYMMEPRAAPEAI